MAKLVLSDVTNILGNPTSAQNTINNNSSLTESALEDTLSRSGQSPNQMLADFDLNHNDLINGGVILADSFGFNTGLDLEAAITQAAADATRAEVAADESEDHAQDSEDFSELSQAWAEGTEPGGVGTKSAREWSVIAETAVGLLNNVVVDSFVGDGVETQFPLSADPGSKNNIDVYVEGVAQLQSAYDLIYITGTPYVQISDPIPNLMPFEVKMGQAIDVGTPSDGSVTLPKLDSAIATTITNAITTTSHPLARNLIINPRFRVNQTAASASDTLTAAEHWYDGWKGSLGSGGTVALSGGVVTISAGALLTYIDGNDIEDGTYTLNWVGTASAAVNGVPKAKGATTVLTAGTQVIIAFSGGTLSFPQFEFGSKATLFEVRHQSVDELLCRHRYELVRTTVMFYQSAASEAHGNQINYSRKRAEPTITANSVFVSTNVATVVFSSTNEIWGGFLQVTGTATPAINVMYDAVVNVDARL